MLRVKTYLAAAGLVCAVGVGVPMDAQASSMSVAAAIKAQDKAIKRSPAYQQLRHFDAKTPAQAKALISKFAALETTVKHAATAVSGASATTSTQKQAQSEWVKGAREEATGIGQLETGVKDLVAGKNSTAKTEVAKAVKTIKAGDVLGAEADKLLGLPSSD